MKKDSETLVSYLHRSLLTIAFNLSPDGFQVTVVLRE